MNKTAITTFFNYNYWANAKVLHAAERLEPGQFLAPNRLSFNNLRGTLAHILSTEWMWRMRIQNKTSPTSMLSAEAFPTIAALAAAWHEEEAAMRTFLNQLQDYHLQQPLSYTTTKGVVHTNPLWQLLAHVVNHGTQFRSEAGVALTEYGFSPGDLDLIVFLRERR